LEIKFPQNINDLSQKGILNLFREKEISLFGFKVPKMVEALNVELQDAKFEERRSDLVYLLEDDSLLHIEFQSTYKKSDLVRFILYDVLLHKQHKKRKVVTVIIYLAGVKRRKVILDFTTLLYKPYTIFLEEHDATEVLDRLEEKILNSKTLIDEDILNLLFTNYMKNDTISVEKKVECQIRLASHIQDDEAREVALATFVCGASKALNINDKRKLKEMVSMFFPHEKDAWQEFLQEMAEDTAREMAVEMARELAVVKAEELAVVKTEESLLEAAKIMLEKKLNLDLIVEITRLPLKKIQALQLDL